GYAALEPTEAQRPAPCWIGPPAGGLMPARTLRVLELHSAHPAEALSNPSSARISGTSAGGCRGQSGREGAARKPGMAGSCDWLRSCPCLQFGGTGDVSERPVSEARVRSP